MSIFAGKLKEYSAFFVDCFDGDNLDSGAYFLSHCHKDHMKGLGSSKFYRKLKESSNIYVYCSETSRNILVCDKQYKHLKPFLVGLSIENPTIIAFKNIKTGKDESVTVTLLSAGHCIGSVMFLFDGSAGTVLYTGDFRWNVGDSKRMKFFHSQHGVRDVKSIYIDTTFYLPQMKHIPSRESSRDAVVELMKRWLSNGLNYYVSLLCQGMYGYEYLLKEISRAFKTKIHVSPERMALYENLSFMKEHFTTEGHTTRIHCCQWEKIRPVNSEIPCGYSLPSSREMKVLKIKATSLWFAPEDKPLPKSCLVEIKQDFYRVLHSMHSSMEEIVDLVSYIRPMNIYPTVEPAAFFSLLETQRSLQQYTRLKEDNIDEVKNNRDDLTGKRTKVLKRKKSLFSENGQDEEVISECQSLGLVEEVVAARPRRRRRKNDTTVIFTEDNESL